MMASKYRAVLGSGWSISIQREMINVSGFSPVADPAWEYTDAAGHEHRMVDGGYPTLVWVPRMVWCLDCHEEHDHGRQECPLCGEHIVPGTKIDSYPRTIPGMQSIFATSPEGDVFPITEDDLARVRTEGVSALEAAMERDGVGRTQVFGVGD